MKEHTKKRNINRGYMKLDVWNNAMELFQQTFFLLKSVQNINYKLRSQIINCTQSISSNIAEGYCRRTIKEYLQFLNIALGSSGESLTRMIGLKEINLINENAFNQFDQKHYEVENKLLGLVKSLQNKKEDGTWIQELHEPETEYK